MAKQNVLCQTLRSACELLSLRAKIGNRNCTNFSDSIVRHRTWPRIYISPSEALNGRKLKITLPEVSPTPATKHTLQETRKTMDGKEKFRTEVKDQGLCRLETGHKTKQYQTSHTSTRSERSSQSPCSCCPGGWHSLMGIGMCGPKGYVFLAVLVINRVSLLVILPPFWS